MEMSPYFANAFFAPLVDCVKDAQCPGHYFCNLESGNCVPVPLGANLSSDLLVGALAFVIAGFSLAAGVGGGGLYVPLLMAALSFDAPVATALSQAMLCGGAVAAFAYNISQTHPRNAEQPLIDFQLAVLLAAGIVCGAQVGTIVHDTAPPAVTVIVLVLVLCDAAKKSVNSAMKIRASECQARDLGESLPEPVERTDSIIGMSRLDEDGSVTRGRTRTAQLGLIYVFVVCIVLVLCKGVLVTICSLTWWLLNLATVVVLGLSDLYFASQLSQHVPVYGASLDFRHLSFSLATKAFLAGTLAATCGIGGGMVMGPILVQMDVPPPVAAATTATTLLLMSSSTCLVFLCRGVAPLDYSVFLSCVTMGGAYTGKVLIGSWVKRTGKESLIVWCLAGITVLSVLIMGLIGLSRVFDPEKWRFHNVCDSGKVI